uniref:Ovule protein n=1 Tax=Parascaris univalens TaxID=6257 RepID=A0A914ZJQ5_PARUN
MHLRPRPLERAFVIFNFFLQLEKAKNRWIRLKTENCPTWKITSAIHTWDLSLFTTTKKRTSSLDDFLRSLIARKKVPL